MSSFSPISADFATRRMSGLHCPAMSSDGGGTGAGCPWSARAVGGRLKDRTPIAPGSHTPGSRTTALSTAFRNYLVFGIYAEALCAVNLRVIAALVDVARRDNTASHVVLVPL